MLRYAANFDKDSVVAKISETISAKEQLLAQLSMLMVSMECF